jgi:hypothetical protein
MARYVTCDQCGLRSLVRITKVQSARGESEPDETYIIDCPSCGIHEAPKSVTEDADEDSPVFQYSANRFGLQVEDWDHVITEIAQRGWTLAILPTGMPVGVLGTVIIMSECDPGNNAAEIMEAVGVDDVRSDSKAILRATLRLCRTLDPTF